MSNNIEKYYKTVIAGAFNDANPERFFKRFAGMYKTSGVAVRLQESAVNRTDKFDPAKDDAATLANAISYARSLMDGLDVDKQVMTETMNQFRKGSHMRIDDLPDWEGDTVYAFINSGTSLRIPKSWFDEVDFIETVTLHDKAYDVYRLWWD